MAYINDIYVTSVQQGSLSTLVDVNIYYDSSNYKIDINSIRIYSLSFIGSWRTQSITTRVDVDANNIKITFNKSNFTNDITDLLYSPTTKCYSATGFFVYAKVYGAASKPGFEPWFNNLIVIDELGAHPLNENDGLLNLVVDYSAKLFQGLAVPGLDAPPAIPDYTNLYVSPLYEERNIETGSGTVDNPLYNVYEAITLASLISVKYEQDGTPRPVNIYVSPGEYEIMQASWSVVPGCNVSVFGDTSSTPFIYNNEDFNYAKLCPYGGQKYHYGSILPDSTTILKFDNMSIRGLELQGSYGVLSITNCDFQLSRIGRSGGYQVVVKNELILEDNNFSDSELILYAPIASAGSTYFQYLDSDSTYESSKWFLGRNWKFPTNTTLWDSLVNWNPVYDAAPLEQIHAIFPDKTSDRICKSYNFAASILYHPDSSRNSEIEVERLDYYDDIWELNHKTSFLGNWDIRDTVFSIKRNFFRDFIGSPYFVASHGQMFFTNNVGTCNVYMYSGQKTVVENNTFNGKYITSYKHGVDAIWNDGHSPQAHALASNIQYPFGSWCPSEISFNEHLGDTIANDYIITYAVDGTLGSDELPDPYLSRGRKYSFQNNAGYFTHSEQSQIYSATLYKMMKGFWDWFYRMGYTSNTSKTLYPSDPTTSPTIVRKDVYTKAYNIGTIPNAQFEDLISFFPTSDSTAIDAGNPDSSYNDQDLSRNDIGAYGGPDSNAYVKSVIRWVESFVNVNYVQLIEGSIVNLTGLYSKRSPKSPLTYTWSDDTGNPVPVTGDFVNNGTIYAAEQDATLPVEGTYRIYLEVDDGTTSDTETVDFIVQKNRYFCVDPSKAFSNDIIGGIDATEWTHIAYPGQTQYDPYLETISLDVGDQTALKFDWVLHHDVDTSAATRYYLKLYVSQQHTRNVNNTLSIGVLIRDENTKAVLFHDTMYIKGSGLLTFTRNMMDSRTYGVGSCYFATPADTTNVRIYVYETPYDSWKETHLVKVWMAPADEILDEIYQDARLAIRHSAIGDEIRLAGDQYIDVPLRVAGKKVHFNISGGWDTASYDGTTYLTCDPDNHPTYLNYIRFAWFNRRQREWSNHAIDLFLPVYFDSTMKNINIVNLNEDLPSSYEYQALSAYMTQHADILFKNINIHGILKAGYIRSNVDPTTPHNLTVTDCTVSDCDFGLFVHTNNIDATIVDNEFRRITNNALMCYCRNTYDYDVWQSHIVRRNLFQDCARPTILIPDNIDKTAIINRRMSDYYGMYNGLNNEVDRVYIGYAITSDSSIKYVNGNSHSPLLLWFHDNAQYEIDANVFRTVESEFPSALAISVDCVNNRAINTSEGMNIYVHDNTVYPSTANGFFGYASSFSLQTVEILQSYTYPFTTLPRLTTNINWKDDFTDSLQAANYFLDRTESFIDGGFTLIQDNTISDTRSVLEFFNSTGGHSLCVPHIVRSNKLMNVYSVFFSSPYIIFDDVYFKGIADTHTWFIDGSQGETQRVKLGWRLGYAQDSTLAQKPVWIDQMFKGKINTQCEKEYIDSTDI